MGLSPRRSHRLSPQWSSPESSESNSQIEEKLDQSNNGLFASLILQYFDIKTLTPKLSEHYKPHHNSKMIPHLMMVFKSAINFVIWKDNPTIFPQTFQVYNLASIKYI